MQDLDGKTGDVAEVLPNRETVDYRTAKSFEAAAVTLIAGRYKLVEPLVELEVLDAISPECVRTTLKKTNCSRGGRSSG